MKTPFILLLCLFTFAAQVDARPHSQSGSYAASVKESTAKAVALYPEYAEAGTPLHQAVQDEIARQKAINPDYFKNADWPERIARACAAVLGIEPARPMQASK